MLKGSCACGRVTYEIHGLLIRPITYCHCWRCRKHSGSSFGTTAGIRTDDLLFTAGEDALSYWESSPGIRRYFASCCGSPIYKSDDDAPKFLGVRLGTLDSDPSVSVDVHYMIESRVPWVEISDNLDQKAGGGPPFGTRD